MMKDTDLGLVLEGGGMRGVFTSGVLDWMLEHQVSFPYVVAVSAGASNALSYLSYQKGRAKYTFADLQCERHYLGVRNMFKYRSIMDMDLLYRELPQTLYPYDYEAYRNNPARLESVAIDCLSGEACYLEEKVDKDRIIDIVRASSSLPFACPVAYVDGRPMLDGGIADSIPLQRAISQGYARNVVVLTRNYGYRKKVGGGYLPPWVYRKYPKLREALRTRNQRYNRQLEWVEQLEREGRIIVIRPQKPIEVRRIETDIEKMDALYLQGYEQAEMVLTNFLK